MIQWSILIGIYYRTGDYRLYLYTLASYDHFRIGCCCCFDFFFTINYVRCAFDVELYTQILFVWNIFYASISLNWMQHTHNTASGYINDIEIVVSSLAVHIQQCKQCIMCQPDQYEISKKFPNTTGRKQGNRQPNGRYSNILLTLI